MGSYPLCTTNADCPTGDECRKGTGGTGVCLPGMMRDGGFPPPLDGGAGPD
jgi:Cys-rich repeat protein